MEILYVVSAAGLERLDEEIRPTLVKDIVGISSGVLNADFVHRITAPYKVEVS